MTQINTYTVRYNFCLDNTIRELHATSEGVSPMHVAGMVSAELSDMLSLPRVHIFEQYGAAFAQVGHGDGMYAALSVEAV